MDLKGYYRKIREAAAGIAEEWPVVVSRATPEGGRAGELVEASREVAARLIVEGAAELASPEQAAAFRERVREMQAAEEARQAAARIHVSVITEGDARKMHHKDTKDTKIAKKSS
jgi:hypothetical protein